jgi:hypothetical protein
MHLRAVSPIESGFDIRMNASSVGLLAVKVATAAARFRAEGQLNDRDRRVLGLVIADLTQEARIFRGEIDPDVDDETSYAVAGIALNALGARASANGSAEDAAATQLESLVSQLVELEHGDLHDVVALEEIERLFLDASSMVTSELSHAGEEVDGNHTVEFNLSA